jgi:hypothetical protein
MSRNTRSASSGHVRGTNHGVLMSQMGPKAVLTARSPTSALHPKADSSRTSRRVRKVPGGEVNKPFAGSVLHSMQRTSLPPAHERARERSAGLTLKDAISERSPFFRHTQKKRCGICGTRFQRLIAYSESRIFGESQSNCVRKKDAFKKGGKCDEEIFVRHPGFCCNGGSRARS